MLCIFIYISRFVLKPIFQNMGVDKIFARAEEGEKSKVTSFDREKQF